jgi:hypothetical protein
MYDQTIVISVATLAIIAVLNLATIVYLHKQNAPVRTTVVQFWGITMFIPFVFLLAIWAKIDSEVVATLLGAFAGYLFGMKSLAEEWGGKSEENPPE